MESQQSGMCILHLANDFAGSKVYKNLFAALDTNYNLKQIVYTAIRSHELTNKNRINFEQQSSHIIYRHILNPLTRILFRRKIKKIALDIEKCVDLKNVDMIHAHTWYSDGGAAYLLSKKYNIPYVVTVRSSDTEIFFKYMLHLRGFGKRILVNAKNVVFLTPTYASRILRHKYFDGVYEQLAKKHYVIPNGIDEFWLRNFADSKNEIPDKVRLIYVGTFLKRKNVTKVIDAVEYLRKKGDDVSLTLVGGGGADHDRVIGLIKNKAYYNYVGKIVDKVKLKELYNEADIFVMPSVRETFGLVYLEAISQGLPIIYLANDGIDGLFDTKVGIALNKDNIGVELPKAIISIAANLPSYSFFAKQTLEGYGWPKMAEKYMKMYKPN